MRPLILDLSAWRPFGLDAHALLAGHLPWLIALTVGGFLLMLWGQGRAAASGKRFHWGVLAGSIGAMLGVLAMAFALARVNSYGLMLALGFLTAVYLARRRARRCGENPDVVTTLGVLALVGGVVGARVAYVVEHWREFADPHAALGARLADMAAITSGGLVYDGGLALGLLLVIGYLWWRKLPLRRFLDIVAVSAMVGLAFGRMGCFLNGCCYGGVVHNDFPLGVHFPYAARPLIFPGGQGSPYPADTHVSPVYASQVERGLLWGQVPPDLLRAPGQVRQPGSLTDPQAVQEARHAHSLPVHPAQLYASAGALLLAGLLAGFFRLRSREGQVAALLFTLYPIMRFMEEVIRDDNPGMAITPAQGKSLVLLALGVALLVALRWLPASCGPTWNQRFAAAAAQADQSASTRSARPKRRRR